MHNLALPGNYLLGSHYVGSYNLFRFGSSWLFLYEGVPINNQPIPFPIDRDGHDFHALFQYMFYTWVQNWVLREITWPVNDTKIWSTKIAYQLTVNVIA